MNAKKAPTSAAEHQQSQYSDGQPVPDQPVDLDYIVAEFEHLDADARSSFLCMVAHDLTVAIRSVVYDPPVTQEGLDRIKWINEALHHLTSCVNPHDRWSAHHEAQLIRDIAQDAARNGFGKWLDRAIAVAAANTVNTKRPAAAKR